MNAYNVVVLGSKGSGKTVYLAKMYEKLSDIDDFGYFVYASTVERAKLRAVLHDTDSGRWPNATPIASIDEFTFDVVIDGEVAARLIWYDYAGRRLTEPQTSTLDAQTADMIDTAHATIGLLDGEAIHGEIRLQLPRNETFWNMHVKLLCDHLTQVKDKAIHFIVNKWDLFDDSDQSLREVRNLLEGFPPFKNLVDSRRHFGGITRLIPISSVGYGFCDDGTLVKRRRAPPQPLRVELPFACALHDLILAAERQPGTQWSNRRSAAIADLLCSMAKRVTLLELAFPSSRIA